MQFIEKDKLLSQLKKHEGLRLRPYSCTTGALTIGYGRNLDAKGISDLEAEFLLLQDVAECIKQCERYIPAYHSLNEPRKRVIINMCFNLGISGLLKFVNTLKFIEQGDYKEAATNMLASKWARQVKSRAVELARIMETGVDDE